MALGSELAQPDVPGLAGIGFDVDTYAAAVRLNDHIAALGEAPSSLGRSTVVVVGAGFTGIEVATEMLGKLIARLRPASAELSSILIGLSEQRSGNTRARSFARRSPRSGSRRGSGPK